MSDLYDALAKIEDLLIATPWTEREAHIYSIACAALNLADEEFDQQGPNNVMPCCHPKSAIRGNGITHWCHLREKEGAE